MHIFFGLFSKKINNRNVNYDIGKGQKIVILVDVQHNYILCVINE